MRRGEKFHRAKKLIREYLAERLTLQEAADRYGLTREGVRVLLLRHGITARACISQSRKLAAAEREFALEAKLAAKREAKRDRKRLIATLYVGRMPVPKIAALTNLSERGIRQRVHRMGLYRKHVRSELREAAE